MRDAAALLAFLGQRLPPFMLPARIVFLDALPLTRNGKVDRAALPAPDESTGRAFEAPATPTQAALADLWSEILGLERVGLHENVFDLGAHSLAAMRAVVRIRAAFGVDVQLRHLFERPTVAGLAEIVDGLAWAAAPAVPAAGDAREELTL
jgi:acyl carrier protein